MHDVLAALQYEEASSYSILIKCNVCNFTLWMLPALDAQGHRLIPPLLCTPLELQQFEMLDVPVDTCDSYLA